MMRKISTVLVLMSLLSAVPQLQSLAAEKPVVAPAKDLLKPNVSQTAVPKPVLNVRVVIDSLYCRKESKWDHGTSQDEPYVMVTGFASHKDPNAWILGEPEVFADVDSGNNRRFRKQNRVVYSGEVPKGASVGFHVALWERDSSPKDTQYNLYQQMCRRISDNISTCMEKGDEYGGTAGMIVATIYGMVHSGWIAALQQAASIVGGGGDDKVAEAVVGWDYEDLVSWNQEQPYHHTMLQTLDGGNEGNYMLRYHIEFGSDGAREYDLKFTEWDDLAIGALDRASGDEIVTVSDEAGPGADGRFCVYGGNGRLICAFDAPFAPYDRIAVADTTGSGVCEILAASTTGGGIVRTLSPTGALLNRMNIPFAKYDGFAAGDIDGDGKAEIVVVRSSDRKVMVYSPVNGEKIHEFALNWPFKGARYTSKNTKHDAVMIGDVVGDSKAEIVLIENKDGEKSVVHVYNRTGGEVVNPFTVGSAKAVFTHYDAAALGDLYGDSKKELILMVSGDTKVHTYTTYIIDVASAKQVGKRHYTWYDRYCGLAAGAVLSPGKAQIVVASRSDGKLQIGR